MRTARRTSASTTLPPPCELLRIVRLTMLLSPMRVFLPTSLVLMLTGVVYSVWEALARGLGVPVLGATLVINGMIVCLFGLLSDQVSALRLERLQLRPVESTEEPASAGSAGSAANGATDAPHASGTAG